MENKILKGRLERWNDNKGFGFIHPENKSRDVFIHISAFKKEISRRPKIGDVIFYQVHIDNDGRSRAINARVEGVTSNQTISQPVTQRGKSRKNYKVQWFSRLSTLIFLVIIAAAFFVYIKVTKEQLKSESSINIQSIHEPEEEYGCEGKTSCSEMTSCEEAIFYLQNCPGTKMDGDHDGTPCESQWCGY